MTAPTKLLGLILLLLTSPGCSIWWRYVVPSGRQLYSVKAPSDVRLLVDGQLFNGGVSVLLEIINERRSELWVEPHRIEIRDAAGVVVPVSFAKDSPACDGRTQEGRAVLSFREVCRVQVSFRPREAKSLTLRHHGLAREGAAITLSIALLKDER